MPDIAIKRGIREDLARPQGKLVMSNRHSVRIGRYSVGRFRFLLCAIVLMFALRPFLEGYARIGLLTDIFFCLILLSGASAFNRERKTFFVALVILLPALLLEAASHFSSSGPIEIAKKIVFALFLAYVLAVILSHIFREKEVTEDLITGAVCSYFLIGILWAFVFHFLELAREGSLYLAEVSRHDIGPFLYYSFITLTTVGYGDVVPLTSSARSFAILEAVTGQLYLAIIIARLVGVHASGSRPGTKEHGKVNGDRR